MLRASLLKFCTYRSIMGRKRATSAAAPDAAAAPAPKRRAAVAGGASGGGAAAAPAEPNSGARPKADFYLMKSEPDTFSLDDLAAKPNATDGWEGVRNAVARNHMRAMRAGDRAFFYHSSCKVPGIVGVVEVVREAYPDPTQFDRGSEYYDARSDRDAPKWHQVDVRLERRLKRQITLEELKGHSGPGGALEGMALFRTARLSVQPVTRAEWEFILGLEGAEAPAPAAKGKGKGQGKGGGGGRKAAAEAAAAEAAAAGGKKAAAAAGGGGGRGRGKKAKAAAAKD